MLRQCIEPLGLSITDAAAALGVTRTTLSELVNGKRGISPEMAVRLERFSAAAPKAGLCNRRSMTLPTSAPTASSLSGSNPHRVNLEHWRGINSGNRRGTDFYMSALTRSWLQYPI